MTIFMLLFKWGGCVALFLVAASAAALLTLLILSKPKLWMNRLKIHDADHTNEFIHSKKDFSGKGAIVAAAVVFSFMMALPLLLTSTCCNGRILHAEIIKMIMRALS